MYIGDCPAIVAQQYNPELYGRETGKGKGGVPADLRFCGGDMERYICREGGGTETAVA